MSTQHPDTHAGHDQVDTTGTHGMLLFGEEVLYFSHLPMFHPRHGFQVIVEVGFDDATLEVLAADRQAGTEHIHTFEPERFAITELDPFGRGPARTSLRGMLFRGHFERGGTPIAENVVAQVREVVHFRTLDREAAHDDNAALSYLVFGRDGQFHLAHYISARPDFDHILSGRLIPGSIETDKGESVPDDAVSRFDLGQPMQVEGRDDIPAERLNAHEIVRGLFAGQPTRTDLTNYVAQLEILRDIYLEIGELA